MTHTSCHSLEVSTNLSTLYQPKARYSTGATHSRTLFILLLGHIGQSSSNTGMCDKIKKKQTHCLGNLCLHLASSYRTLFLPHNLYFLFPVAPQIIAIKGYLIIRTYWLLSSSFTKDNIEVEVI